jgi:MFS family permease
MSSVSSLEIFKVTIASSIGTFLEWYAFFIAGIAAAQVWPHVFYGKFTPAVAFALSLVSYGIIFFTRPIGSWIFGWLGDRKGRKEILTWTLIITGTATLGIALIPSYSSIGILAPTLLNLFRAIQGIGLGGEFGGATSWVLENVSASKWRALWTSWVQWTVPFGTLLATYSYLLVHIFYKGTEFLIWGWRIPFIVAFAVAIIGIIIRYYMPESPLFNILTTRKMVEKAPFSTMLKKEWKKVILLSFLFSYISIIYSGMVSPVSLKLLGVLHVPPETALIYISYGLIFALFTLPLGGFLGDVIGRRFVAILSTFLTVISASVFFTLIKTVEPLYITLGEVTLIGFAYIFLGVVPAFYTESFSIFYRYSGSGFSFQLGNLIAGVIVSIVIPIFIASSHGILAATNKITVVAVLFTIISLISALLLKDTKNVDVTL